MATHIRRLISKRVLNSLEIPSTRKNQERVGALLKLSEISKKQSVDGPQFKLTATDSKILTEICEHPDQFVGQSKDLSDKELDTKAEELVQDIQTSYGDLLIRVCPKCLSKVRKEL
ncbi:uncharacterized protein LOC135465403 [Liolophura sinensis]|uniref:uncharacterized protein LOC135465403 n=1 Tax=Liolophura sinensis TaxID=3198878 RepID=UPI00315916F1